MSPRAIPWRRGAFAGAGLAVVAVLADAPGRFRLETGRPVPTFGAPHVHAVYDGDEYREVLLRRVVDPDSGAAVVDLTLDPQVG